MEPWRPAVREHCEPFSFITQHSHVDLDVVEECAHIIMLGWEAEVVYTSDDITVDLVVCECLSLQL